MNDAPVGVNDHYVIPEDTVLQIIAQQGVLANDSDIDGDKLRAFKFTNPANGIVNFNLDGSFSYTPNPNFNGLDSFIYKISDGTLGSNETTVSIDVHAVNDAPVAQADVYNTPEDTPIKVTSAQGVLNNDIDPDGDTFAGLQTSAPAHGKVKWVPWDGSSIYTPNTNFNGTDSFTYKAWDGHLLSNEVTITINVHPVDDAPVATDDLYSVGEDGFLKVTVAKGLLANDHDVDGNILRVNSIVSSVANGALQMSLDGSFTYKPNFGFFGTDSFTYKANDGKVNSVVATVTITVTHVNHPVLPNADAYTITQGDLLTVTTANGLLANDLDIDGDTLLVSNIPTSVSHGTLQMMLDGSFTYKPDPGYSGPG
ncbi:tandem-95 repeat protein [Bathymodiolus japonicus methanotrophic gill symbiont]|uniref:tandem-95 repeat protein n=1 Tax=Bathymodiolus japonicus methanotrophic gill symbiont TaxID=113269 RepID=UPI001C8D3F1F|nr:Ig-like domain-containing protein [Bathymodiolus japonicus methanotrophic gill symbiont]